MNSSDELNQFKTSVNLIDYATSLGYYIDKQESSRSNVVMRDDQNDKIIITQQSNTQHWIYWSDRDQADKGTIIDFIQRRRRLSLGEVRKELRSWNGNISLNFINKIHKSSPNLEAVRNTYDTFDFIQKHPYLINGRSIPLSTLKHHKFHHKIKIDSRGNAIFPHFSNGQVIGYEIKNKSFTGFSLNGKKGLWCSNWDRMYRTLMITESAIDALSFHALYDEDKFFYASFAGQLGKEQTGLIQKASTKFTDIIVATDNDSKGDEYYYRIQNFLKDFKNITRIKPINKDWNEDLQKLSR